jgi:hypothetical protein
VFSNKDTRTIEDASTRAGDASWESKKSSLRFSESSWEWKSSLQHPQEDLSLEYMT